MDAKKWRVEIGDLDVSAAKGLSEEETARITGGVELENTLISSYSISGTGGDSTEYTDTFGRVKVQFSWDR